MVFAVIYQKRCSCKEMFRQLVDFPSKCSPTLASAPRTRYVNPFPAAEATTTTTTELSLWMRLNAAPLFCYLTKRYGLDVHSAITIRPYTYSTVLDSAHRNPRVVPLLCVHTVADGMTLCDSGHAFFILILLVVLMGFCVQGGWFWNCGRDISGVTVFRWRGFILMTLPRSAALNENSLPEKFLSHINNFSSVRFSIKNTKNFLAENNFKHRIAHKQQQINQVA